MRQTRFMSLLFLVWSIGFFFVPEFRQGLQLPVLLFTFGESLPAEVLDKATRAAKQKGDARTLAFAALHAANESERQPSPQSVKRSKNVANRASPRLRLDCLCF